MTTIHGKIYAIRNRIDDKIYIGSTVDRLSKRFRGHMRDARNQSNRKIYSHFNAIGWENCYIELLDEDEFKSKEALRAREQKWIRENDTMNNGLNSQRAFQTPDEEKMQHDEGNRAWAARERARGYRCDVCQRAFTRKNDLNKHNVTITHRNNTANEDESEAEDEIDEEADEANEANEEVDDEADEEETQAGHHCEVCEHTFTRASDLTRHYKTKKHRENVTEIENETEDDEAEETENDE